MINRAIKGDVYLEHRIIFLHNQKVRWHENLARADDGLREEVLNFLDFFVSFLCQDKNESPSGRTNIEIEYIDYLLIAEII